MKRKRESVVFVVLCLVICLTPFVGMTVARTDATTENKRLAAFPALKSEAGWNVDFLAELGNYFEDHFAFREALVSADSLIQSRVFGVSNMDTVLVGEKGWLYYTDTLDDYFGKNTLSHRGLYNVAHNLSLLQGYVKGWGADFVLAIAPNKNTLYGDAMPYYYAHRAANTSNLKRLGPMLKQEGVSYCDLYKRFADEDEVLYLKRDSHWNGKGALLAYNGIMEQLSYEHETYETTPVLRRKTEYGDLNKMLYPLAGEPEWNYEYQYQKSYAYVTETESVEDAFIETRKDGGKKSLLMFRDSFGNTLLPFFAEAFGKAYFSKGEPYAVEHYRQKYRPDVVVVEKVERNISDFAKNPPLMTGPIVKEAPEAKRADTKTDIRLADCRASAEYWEIRGRADERYLSEDGRIYVSVTAAGNTTVYEAFTTSDENGDNGYRLYVPKDELAAQTAWLRIMTEGRDGWTLAAERKLSLTEQEAGRISE